MTISIKNIIFLGILSISCGMPLFGMEERRPLPAQEVSLYTLLKLDNNATEEQIKTAFTNLQNAQIESGFKDEENFFSVALAYKILSNNELRECYDNYGYIVAYNDLRMKGYSQKVDLEVKAKIEEYQNVLQKSLMSMDTLTIQIDTKKVNDFYQANLFKGTPELCDTLRDYIAQNYYNLARGLYAVKYKRNQVLEYIKQGLNFALAESYFSNELKALQNELQNQTKSQTELSPVGFQWHQSRESKAYVDNQREIVLNFLNDTNAKVLNALKDKEAFETPTTFCKKIYEYLDALANYDVQVDLKNDLVFLRKRYMCGEFTYKAAEKLRKMSQGTIWYSYGLQHRKILCQKALGHISCLQNLNKYRNTKRSIESDIVKIQGLLDSWYTQGGCLVDFFTKPEIPFDLCKDVWIGMIDDIGRFDADIQDVMLNSTYQLTVRCSREHYYDEIINISSKALANQYIQSRADFVAQYKRLIDSIFNEVFDTCHRGLRTKHENKASAETLADHIIQNYFTIQHAPSQSIKTMFEDILSVYTRLEPEMKWDKMYELAKSCLTFDKWPQHIQIHRLFITMRTFKARYETLKARGRI